MYLPPQTSGVIDKVPGTMTVSNDAPSDNKVKKTSAAAGASGNTGSESMGQHGAQDQSDSHSRNNAERPEQSESSVDETVKSKSREKSQSYLLNDKDVNIAHSSDTTDNHDQDDQERGKRRAVKQNNDLQTRNVVNNIVRDKENGRLIKPGSPRNRQMSEEIRQKRSGLPRANPNRNPSPRPGEKERKERDSGQSASDPFDGPSCSEDLPTSKTPRE